MTVPSSSSSPTNPKTPKGSTNTVKMMVIAIALYGCTILWGLQLNHAETNNRGLRVQGSAGWHCNDPVDMDAPPVPSNPKAATPAAKAPTAPALSYQVTPSQSTGTQPLTILPNELPGYTGWARPVFTLADYFEIIHVPQQVATVGKNWTVKVKCKHPAAKKGGALFYVRAFGAALLPGTVKDHGDGVYTITILPHDAGTYTLEVVLTISQKPDYKVFPQPINKDPSYEGHMLPGFPITLPAIDKTAPKSKPKVQRLLTNADTARSGSRGLCKAKHLTEYSPTSSLETGRWLVTNKTKTYPFTETTVPGDINLAHRERINIHNYKNNRNALGIQMDYFYNDCDVLSYQEMTSKSKWLNVLQKRKNKGKPVHILYVGDSNTRNQYNYFRDHIANTLDSNPKWYMQKRVQKLASTSYLGGQLKLTYIDMMGHWQKTFNKTSTQIQQLVQDKDNLNDDFYVIFNAGLHEISHRCMLNGAKRQPEMEGSCHDVYAKDVRQLVHLLKTKVPASLRVWQDTVAGWPKWGVFGVSWPQHMGQRFPREPNFCAYINEIAFDVMQEQKIPVMDTYWMSLSRPDHREVVQKDTIRTSYKLVHLGDEVYLFLVRKFVHMIFEAIEKGETGVQYL